MSRSMVAAAAKDKAARGMRERSQMKRVGNVLFPRPDGISCAFCNSLAVFEMYEPIRHGFKYWCWDCGSKDDDCYIKRLPQPKPLSKSAQKALDDAEFATRMESLRIKLKVARLNALLSKNKETA